MKTTITLGGEIAEQLISELGETPTISDKIVIEISGTCSRVAYDEMWEGESEEPKKVKSISFDVDSVNYAEFAENEGEEEQGEGEEEMGEEEQAEMEEQPAKIKENPALAKVHAKIKKAAV